MEFTQHPSKSCRYICKFKLKYGCILKNSKIKKKNLVFGEEFRNFLMFGELYNSPYDTYGFNYAISKF